MVIFGYLQLFVVRIKKDVVCLPLKQEMIFFLIFTLMLFTISEGKFLLEWKPVIRHFIFWSVIFLFNVSSDLFIENSNSLRNSYNIGQKSLMILFHLAAIIVTSYFILWIGLPLFFKRKKILKSILQLVIGLYLICVISRFSIVYILEPVIGGSFGEKESLFEIALDFNVLFQHYLIGIFTGAIPFFLMYLLSDRHQIKQKQLQAEKEKKALELNALKSQLNPHFLFNTLNNIYSLAIQQSPLASKSIEKLSYILDYTLYRCNDNFVPLEKEFDLLNNYIELEKIRYNTRLKIHTDFSYDASYQIAPLLLLSLVENMFKHGVEKTTGNAVLQIKIEATNHTFLLLAKNTFDLSGNDEQGIGLKNVQQQLQLLYPDRHHIKIEKIDNLFILQLKIQL